MAEREYLFFFADLIDSTEIAYEKTVEDYAKFYRASLHWACNAAWYWTASKHPALLKRMPGMAPEQKILAPPRIAGDEVYSFTPLKSLEGDEGVGEVVTAIGFAYALKLFWMATPYNLERIMSRHAPREIGIGIHIGRAEEVPSRYLYRMGKPIQQIGGEHISATKRIESASRKGRRSRIYVSEKVRDKFTAWREDRTNRDARTPLIAFFHFGKGKSVRGKGIAQPMEAYELELDTHSTNRAKFKEMAFDIEKELGRPRTYVDFLFRDMGETLLVPGKRPFADRHGKKFVHNVTAKSAVDYMRDSLGTTENSHGLYREDAWDRFNYFCVNAMWIWHRDSAGIAEDEKKRYRSKIAHNLEFAIDKM